MTSLTHIAGRANLLRELWRVMKSGGRLLFSDALVVGGILSDQEVATRSLIGNYFFSPPGENERLLKAAGFAVASVTDTTDAAATISMRRHQARQRRNKELIAAEGQANFEGQQRFLECVHALTLEKRLLRLLYLARKI